MGANSNYPAGTWAGDPNAPWNIPDIPDEDEEEEEERDEDSYGDDWYAEESADYLHKEVFEPIIARWGE